jgi:hypothetical protein
MGSLVIVLFVLWAGWRAYWGAKKAGVWSTKVFLGVLLGIAVLIALISIPIYLIPPAAMQAHIGLALTGILSAIGAGVVVITIYTNRWWKSVLQKRSGQNSSGPPDSSGPPNSSGPPGPA